MKRFAWRSEEVRETFAFLLKLNLLALPLYLAMYLELSFEPLQEFFSWLVVGTLNLLGYQAEAYGKFMKVEELPFLPYVSWDSTGWKSLYFCVALVAATPRRTWKTKALYALLAIPCIFLVNYARLLTTMLLTINFGAWAFDLVHSFLWREGLIFFVLFYWILFVYMTKK